MPLDPQARFILDAIAQLNLPDITTLSPDAAKASAAQRAQRIPPGPDAAVEERSIPSPSGPMPVRIYRPLGSAQQRLPAVVFFHGGGFVIGNIQQADADCRRLATGVPCAAVNVEYPL